MFLTEAYPHALSWSHDGRIFFQTGEVAGPSWVSASGGPRVSLTSTLAQGMRELSFVAHTEQLLMSSVGLDGGNDVALVSAADGAVRPLPLRGFGARYVPTGHVVFVSRCTMLAAPFDVDRLETTGPAAPVHQRFLGAGTPDGEEGAEGLGCYRAGKVASVPELGTLGMLS